MADAIKILADIDAQWESAKGKLADAQTDYASKEGRYFQLLPTMTTARQINLLNIKFYTTAVQTGSVFWSVTVVPAAA